MLSDGKRFDTNIFFSGGAGMFIQYHDVIKPVYLYAVWKMIMTNDHHGLPLGMLKNMSILSFIEWYVRRRYLNPLQCLDITHSIDPILFDNVMKEVLQDTTIYTVAPGLNIRRMFSAYHANHLSFPVYVYSQDEEAVIKEDSVKTLYGIDVKYLHGDLKDCIKKCDQNFTYIFSDIELLKSASEVLHGTCSHLLLASDYRYNLNANGDPRYNLEELAKQHPFIRIGMTKVLSFDQLARAMILRQ